MNSIRLIPSLFYSGRPPTVFLTIITHIINSINGQIIRHFSHIIQKITKIISPFITNFNTLSSIPLKIFSIGVCTPLNHVHPTPICRTNKISSRMAMWFSHFFLTVFALGSFPPPKLDTRNNSDISTFTDTFPISTSFWMVWNQCIYKPITESLPRNIFVIFSHKKSIRIANQTIQDMGFGGNI